MSSEDSGVQVEARTLSGPSLLDYLHASWALGMEADAMSPQDQARVHAEAARRGVNVEGVAAMWRLDHPPTDLVTLTDGGAR